MIQDIKYINTIIYSYTLKENTIQQNDVWKMAKGKPFTLLKIIPISKTNYL